MTLDRVFERTWPLTLLGRVSARLRSEHEAAGELDRFETLKHSLTPAVRGSTDDEIAEALEVIPAGARQAVSRLRKFY